MKVQDIVGTVKRKDRNNRKHRKVQPDNLYQVNVKKLSEGGAMDGVGAIHHTEIDATLDALEKSLGVSLKDNVLGSVGKKEFSGDIDVAIDIPKEKLQDFAAKLEASPLIQDIKKSSVFMTSVDIVGYNSENTKPGVNRTGKVQIDFMPGNPDWMKTYYHKVFLSFRKMFYKYLLMFYLMFRIFLLILFHFHHHYNTHNYFESITFLFPLKLTR